MNWPLSDAGLCAQGGADLATSGLTTLTASATPNTAGAWVELHAATPWAAETVWLQVFAVIGSNAADTCTLIDVGIGAAASEIVLVDSIPIGFLTLCPAPFLLPLHVPAGSRLSARIRSAVASKTTTAQVRIFGGGLNGPGGYGRATTYGADTATSSGTLVTAPGATNTKGAWKVISAATTNPMRAMLVVPTSRSDSTIAAKDCLFDVGYGAAASEVVVIPDIPANYGGGETLNCPFITAPVNIPAGVRLVARYQATSTADVPAIVIIGFD